MAGAPIVVPFDFEPSNDSTVTTSGFTVDAGEYELLTVVLEEGATFSIDGTVALRSVSPSNVDVSNSGGTDGLPQYTCPSGKIFEGRYYNDFGPEAPTFNGDTLGINTLTGKGDPIILGPGGTFSTPNATSGQRNLIGYERDIAGYVKSGNFWVPSGSVIAVTGTVRIYRQVYNQKT